MRLYIVSTGTTAAPKSSTLAVAAAAFVAEQGLKFVAREMEKEAERYEAQYSAVNRFSTEEIRADKYIVFVRGADLPRVFPKNAFHDLLNEEFDADNVMMAARDAVEAGGGGATLSPHVSSLLIMKIAPTAAVDVWEVQPVGIYACESKAKIVSWGKWPPKWLCALLLKTGDKVNVRAEVHFEGLSVMKKDGQSLVSNSSLLDLSLPVADLKLQKQGDTKCFGEKCGAYLHIPLVAPTTVGGKPDVGLATLRITVTESDPSNVKKYLVSGAEQLSKKAEDTDWKKLFSGLGL
jgi:hypothetical protein